MLAYRMAKTIQFTQAQMRRAIKGAESAGMRVSSVTIGADGSITVGGEQRSLRVAEKVDHLAGWEDA